MDIHQELKDARERKHLTLCALRNRTGIKEDLLAEMERGAFQELPTGLYGRHIVRTYARAVGLNEDEVLAAVTPLLRRAEDPLDGLARLKGLPRPRQEPTEVTRPRVEENDRQPEPMRAFLTPVTMGAGESVFARTALASAIDGAILTAISLVLIQLTAMASGLRPVESAVVAAPAFVLLMSVLSATYFVLLAGVRNATFGQALAYGHVESRPGTLDAPSAIRRGLTCALREGSIVVEWFITRSVESRVMTQAEDGYRSL